MGDLLDVGGSEIVRLEAPAEQVAEAQDGGEHVVEVVRDPAREPSDRLQPEALLELLLGVPALRQIEDDARDLERGLGRGVGHAPAHRHDPVHAAVGPDDAVLGRVSRALVDGARPARPRALAIVGVDRLEQAGPRHGLVGRHPEQRLGAGVHEIGAGGEIVLPGAEPRGLQGQLQRVLFPAELLLHRLGLRQVAQPPGEPEQAPLAIVYAGGGDRSPEAAAVFAEQPAVGGELPKPGCLGQVRGRGTGLAIVDGIEVSGGGLKEFGLLVAQHSADAGVPAGRSSPHVQQDDRVVLDLVERCPEALLRLGLFGRGEETLGELRLDLVRRGFGAAIPRGPARDRPPPDHDGGDDDEHEQEEDGRRRADGRQHKQDEYGE